MGAENASNSHSEYGGVGGGDDNFDTQVVLNIYDLTPVNHYTVWFGFGIFHSGIEGSVCSCLLPESLQVTTVKQLPEYHACTEEDGIDSLSSATHEPTESDDADQDKLLLSPTAGTLEVNFIKEVQR
ncbi:hypothetical protein CsSME_00023080 [Camellia sinensis var. sinensis]